MKLGIVGLPNVGKSSLFNAITDAGADSQNYPFCTIDPNVGVVAVPDERLQKLADIYEPDKVTPAVIEFVDIAGLVKGASHGEGLGNRFLSHIRQVDAIVHVVRCFDDPNIVHVSGRIDPADDIRTVNFELTMADLETVAKARDRAAKLMKGDKSAKDEHEFLSRLYEHLDAGEMARTCPTDSDAQADYLATLPLLSNKPVIYAANLSEADFTGGYEHNPLYGQVVAYAHDEGAQVIPICAKLEEEIASMGDDDKQLFLSELGLDSSGLERLIAACYALLGLISYLTAGKPEVRAWTIERGTKAPQAAGKIHSDFERGFIRAEVVPYDVLVELGSTQAARDKGLMRSEGKDYVVQDGDVILFRFNV